MRRFFRELWITFEVTEVSIYCYDPVLIDFMQVELSIYYKIQICLALEYRLYSLSNSTVYTSYAL